MSTKVLKIALMFGILAAVLVTMTPTAILAGGRGEPGPDGAVEQYAYVAPPYTGNVQLYLALYPGDPEESLFINGTVAAVNDKNCWIKFDNFFLVGYEQLILTDIPLSCTALKPNDLSGIYAEYTPGDPTPGIGSITCNCDCADPFDGKIKIELLTASRISCDSTDESGTANVIIMRVKLK